MFSRVSVILFTGRGVYPSMHCGRHTPPGQTHTTPPPHRGQTPPQADNPMGRHPLPPHTHRRLLQPTVRILLECILVLAIEIKKRNRRKGACVLNAPWIRQFCCCECKETLVYLQTTRLMFINIKIPDERKTTER